MKLKLIALNALLLLTGYNANAASIVLVQNSTAGQFLNESGSTMLSTAAAGGISIGYFSGVAPLDSAIQALSPATAFSDLVALGYVDVRSTTITSALPDWNYPSPVGGTVQYTFGDPGTVPSGKQLYVLAFDGGSFVSALPESSFAGSQAWAVIKESTLSTPSSSLGAAVFNLQNASGGEVLVGSDIGDNSGKDVRLAGVPEPSRTIFACAGVIFCLIRRRR